MSVWTLIIAAAFVIGVMFDALGSLPYIVTVASFAAVISAAFLILATGLDLTLVLMGALGLVGLRSGWDHFLEQ